jgi:NADPH2:quinone reductase
MGEFTQAPNSKGDFDLILDIRGADSFDINLGLLRTGGRLVLIDSYSGEDARINIGRLLDNSLSVHGSLLRPRTLEQKGFTAAGIRARALPLIEKGNISPVIDQVLGADGIRKAHARMAANEHFGKLVISTGRHG